MAKVTPPKNSQVGYDVNEGVYYGIPSCGFFKLHSLFNKKRVLQKKKVTPEVSICFGVFWLGYKTKLCNNNILAGIKSYNGGGNSSYVSEVKKCNKNPASYMKGR